MKICIFTTTRADFGILKNLIIKIKNEQKFNLKLVAGGSHFSKKYGNSFKEIKENKINIDFKIKQKKYHDDIFSIIKVFNLTLSNSCRILKKVKPDLVLLLGDRYEILSVAVAANLSKIPIAHLYGGEITGASIDDGFRHSITKLSHVHFVANQIYKKRVIQLGENKKNVHVVGGLAADNISQVRILTKKELENLLNIKFKKNNFIVNFHPETIFKNKSLGQIKDLLKITKKFKDTNFFFTAPGLDLESTNIINEIKKAAKSNKNVYFFESLGQQKYFSLIRLSSGMIGNSSSGILEMPYFNKPTLNIGDRQKGRLTSNTIINCQFKTNLIIKKIRTILNKNYKIKKINKNLPYGKKGAVNKIIKILKRLKTQNLFFKNFKDLN